MPSTPPFIDPETGALDNSQILEEAYPLVGLIALVVSAALVPFLLVFLLFGDSSLGLVFTLIAQFILAVGTAIVLLYVVARGIQLADA